VILDVSRQLVITDHFVIASGNNERQVRALASEVERRLLALGTKPARREGEREARWVVLDYLDFVVHLFHHEARDYYELERLWSDSAEVPFEHDHFESDDDSATAQAT
jgi:ribosome-associated protein